MTYKTQASQPGSVTWADTSDITHTLRARVELAPKKTSGITTTNNRSEVIHARRGVITDGVLTAKEAQSIRLVISGSIEGKNQIKADLAAVFASANAMVDAGLLDGFVPTDALVVTGVTP